MERKPSILRLRFHNTQPGSTELHATLSRLSKSYPCSRSADTSAKRPSLIAFSTLALSALRLVEAVVRKALDTDMAPEGRRSPEDAT